MKKVVEHYYCDICGQPTAEKLLYRTIIPVVSHTEEEEGKPCKPHFVPRRMEICPKCADKVIILHSRGARGEYEYKIEYPA